MAVPIIVDFCSLLKSFINRRINIDIRINDVIKIISEKGMGVTFVKDQDDQVIGLITDGDIRRAIDKSNYFFDMTAQDFMNKDFVSVTPVDLASECLKIMAKKKIGCLAVMQGKALVGIVNQKDLVKIGI